MRFPTVLLLTMALTCVATGWASAEMRSIEVAGGESELTLVQQSPDALEYRVRVGELAAMDVTTPEGEFTRLLIPGFHSSHIEGSPELPMMNRLIEVPYGANARVEVLLAQSREYDLTALGITNPVMPAQPSMPKNVDPAHWPFVIDRDAYEQHQVSQELAAVSPQGQLRAVQIGRLEISPVEYYPQENRLVVYEELTLRVVFDGADHAAGDALKARTNSVFFEPLYERFDGYRGLHDNYPDRVGDVVTMVVVAPPEFEAQLAEYVDWKTERGFHTILAITGTPEVGTTTSSIQAYIHDLYNNASPELPAPSFAVFVGDVAQMPTFQESGNCTDRPYCAVDGDIVPDIYYGRLSATNPTMLANILEKTLMYDQFTMPDPSYLGEVCMVSGMDSGYASVWGNGQINYGTTYYFNEAHGIYSHTYLYPESGSNAGNIVQHVSDGVSYINYTAHGSQTSWSDPSFTIANINGLSNYGKYCLAVGNCCQTGTFDYGECFGEAWLRAEDKGAIGYIGGSNNTYWDEDYWWGVGSGSIVVNPTYETHGLGAYDGVFHDHGEAMTQWYVMNACLMFTGNIAVMEAGSGLSTYYWNIYNLSGDPSLCTYMGVPTANPVDHPDAILTSMETITVDGDPNSYIGVTKDGTLVAAGTIGETGTVDLEIWESPLLPGTAQITIMAQNRVPYQANIEILPPSGPFVVFDDCIVDDDQAGDSFGNSDGALDAGETIELVVQLRNVGVDTATNVTAQLVIEDEYVTVTDDMESYGNIPADFTVSCQEDYDLVIEPDCPDGHMITCALTILSDNRTLWETDFNLTIDAPVLSISRVIVDDTATGDGNGNADPGETFDYRVFVENTGHESATGLSISLNSGSGYVQVIQGAAVAAEIAAGAEVELSPTFILSVSAGAPEPNEYPLFLSLTGDFGLDATMEKGLPVGGFWDTMEQGEGTWSHYSGGGSFIDQWHRDSYRNVTPEGGWSWKQGGNGAADYGNLCDGCLATEAIPLAETTTLSFWHWMSAETSSSYPDYCYDGGLIEMSLNGGLWTQVTPDEGYTHLIRTGGTPGPFPQDTEVYSGNFDWTEGTVTLEGYSGTVAFRFRFGSDGAATEEGWYVDDVRVSGFSNSQGIDPHFEPVALHPVLLQNTPNPGRPMTTIAFELPTAQKVRLQVFDPTGRLISTLADGPADAGLHSFSWSGQTDTGTAVTSGVYYYRLQTDDRTMTRSMRFIR